MAVPTCSALCRKVEWRHDRLNPSGAWVERHLYEIREIPIGSAQAEKVGFGEHCLSGALSIGRFVVSRWHVCGGRGPMGIQSRIWALSEMERVGLGLKSTLTLVAGAHIATCE